MRRVLGLLAGLGLASAAWALDAEVDVQQTSSHVAVVQGAPGTAPQEVAVDETLVQGTVHHQQTLAPGLNAEGTFWSSLDTLPSGTPQVLPAHKLDISSHFLEGWLAWEPLPGTLNLGGGKQVVHPSSGFSATPLNFASRGGRTTGAQATSSWEEGWMGTKASWFGDSLSASVFWAPSLSWDKATDDGGLKYLTSSQSNGFTQGQLGFTWGTSDVKALAFQGAGNPRLGLGVDTGWGDDWTFRAEAAGDAVSSIRPSALVGATWTGLDQQTVMAELSRDETGPTPRPYGFVRGAVKLESHVDADAWTKVNLADTSGWLGSSITYTADKWVLSGAWMGAWGDATSDAGSSPLRWKTTLEAKAFF